jgi:branched-chain amino acid transport system ATP-binding protein
MIGTAGDDLLRATSVAKSFNGFQAIRSVSLTLLRGERRALIGPNGAGKTTLFNLLSGNLRPDSGDVVFAGRSIVGLPPHLICKLGIARTFQITSVYTKLTLLRNVQATLFARGKRTNWLFHDASRVDADEAYSYLALVGIERFADRVAGSVSYGDQKRLELAMVLALEPQLLLFDEPTAGVERNARHELVELIKSLCDRKSLTLLFCEHDMDAVFSIADRITVMNHGEILAEGTSDEIRGNAEVRRIYLGAGHEARA